MKRWWLLAALFTAVAIVAQFPAAWVAPTVTRATSGRWRVAEVEGTVWRGRAVLYTYDGASRYWRPARGVRWQVLWGALLDGAVAARLDFDDGGKAALSADATGWALRNLDATLPAAQVAVLLPSTIGDYGWDGTFSARASSFRCTWRRPSCAGQLDLLWNDAATVQIPGPPLGDYSVRVVGEGEALRFSVSTLRGRLHVTGAGEVSRGRLRFTGEAHASAADDVRLESLLRVIGRPGSAPGRYLIEYADTSSGR